MTIRVQTPSPLVSVGPAVASRQRRVLWFLLAGCFAVVAATCGWQIYGDLNPLVSGRAVGYALLFAAVPVLPLVAGCLWLNSTRPEPLRLLFVALIWGALVATFISLRVNAWMAGQIGDQFGASPRSAVFVAPWVEEPAKAAVIFAIAWWRRHDFNSVMAGVVYALMAGIGFAFTENIVYYAQIYQLAYNSNGTNTSAFDAVQHLFLWRGIATPFIHPMFTALTGAGIGFAVRHRHVGVRILAPAAGFCGAALLHMSYNTAASFAVNDALNAVYVAILLPYFLLCLVLLGFVRRYDDRVLAARLRDYTAYGWLHTEDIASIASARGRQQLRRLARRLPKADRARLRAFPRVGTDLGVLRDRLVRGVAGPRELAREAELLARLRALRQEVLLPGQDGAVMHSGLPASSW